MKKFSLFALMLLLCGCGVNSSKVVEIPKTENTLIYENSEFEYGDIILLNELFQNEDITFEDQYLNTETIGDNKIDIKYKKDDIEYQESYNYTIKDSTPPVIHLQNSYSITVGYKKDLEKNIPCIDNYDKNPKCYIEGTYDVNKAGRYELKYIGEDSFGNKNEVPFILIVNNPSKPVYANSTTKFSDVVKKYKNENTMIGIDVSKWQGDINWAKVKEAGAEFAMIRIGTQKDFNTDEIIEDPKFKQNIEGALANNIQVGLYFYSYATTLKEVSNQARYVINKIKGYNVTMPIAFDWESYSSITGRGMSLTDFRNHTYAFINLLEEAGYKGIVYGSKNYLNRFWQPIKKDTWLAHYTYNLAKTNYDHEYKMWQLCSDGKIDGIQEYVDIDIYYK